MRNIAAMRMLEHDGNIKRGDRPITSGGRALSAHPRGTTVTPKSKAHGASIASIKAAESRRRAAYNSSGGIKKGK